ncbi:hypothetical protein CPB85DRAFT_319990 [Mucidula mucida]|nr:hypothetical protein CPB85DRAFT_319990 [Mucidula mucida]
MDLGHFDRFDYDASSETVTLGPGQTWRTVYEKLIPTPVTVMGGRVGYVGVGGFLTGGGLCFLTNMYGLASNTVVDYQIVLADGRVLWASEDPELAQAMRGAGYSFGVVTEIVMKALPKPPRVYAGYLLYPADKLEALAKHVEKLTTENTDPRISLILSLFHAPGFGPICCMSPFIAGIEGEDVAEYAKRPEVFGWAWDYGPLNDNSKVVTFEEAAFINEDALHRPDSTTSWQIGGTMLSSFGSSIFTAGASWVANLQARPDGERFNGAGIFYMPFMKNAFTTTSATKGVWPPPGVTTLSAVSVILSQPGSLPGHPEENATLMREGVKAVEEAAQKEGINVVKNYPNYLIRGSEPTDFYDEETLDLLRKLKKKYDSSDMFNKGIRIGQ